VIRHIVFIAPESREVLAKVPRIVLQYIYINIHKRCCPKAVIKVCGNFWVNSSRKIYF
jgi:hypothetical protein